MAGINRNLAAEGKRGMTFSSEVSFKEEIWNFWYDTVYAMHKASAPLQESPKKRVGFCLFGCVFLFDPAGPIMVNILGQKTSERPYSEPLEGHLEVSVDHCRLKLI